MSKKLREMPDEELIRHARPFNGDVGVVYELCDRFETLREDFDRQGDKLCPHIRGKTTHYCALANDDPRTREVLAAWDAWQVTNYTGNWMRVEKAIESLRGSTDE